MPNAILQCPICSSGIQVAVEVGGQQINCPTCQNPVQLPADLTPFVTNDPTPNTLTSTCSSCHQQIGVTPEMNGQEVACPLCNKTTIVDLDAPPQQVSEVEEVDPDNAEFDEVEFDEAELFAPGFQSSSQANSAEDDKLKNLIHEDRDSKVQLEPNSNLADEIAGNTSEDGSNYELKNESDANLSGFELKLIPHPSLPPKFKSEPNEVPTGAGIASWKNSDDIILPTATGGVQVIDRNTVGIRTNAGRVLIRTTPKEKKEVRSLLRSMIVFAFCTLLLIVVVLILVWLN